MKAVIFDLFETLITEWGREKYTKAKMAEDLGVDCEVFSQEWEKLHHPMYLGEYPDYRTGLYEVIRRIKVTPDESVIDNMIRKIQVTKEACFLNIDRRILDLLKLIKEKGYKLGIISNCFPYEIDALEMSPLLPFFDTILLSCREGLAKPDVKIYQRCCERLGVNPEDCLFVGDGGSKELGGATEASMKAIQAVWFVKEYRWDYENKEGYRMLENPGDLQLLLQE